MIEESHEQIHKPVLPQQQRKGQSHGISRNSDDRFCNLAFSEGRMEHGGRTPEQAELERGRVIGVLLLRAARSRSVR